MIELRRQSLVIRAPEVHDDATCTVDFHRTLRIPDDGRTYQLPPSVGYFWPRHVDDFADSVPAPWLERGGVMLPMYQAEALWIDFGGPYPFALKVAAGKINAVSGEDWRDGLQKDPQDYVVTSEQPWLDGYCVEDGLIRQFVAMPLGSGYSAEEQLTGKAEHGGLQIEAYPLKRAAYDRYRSTMGEARYLGVESFGGEDDMVVSLGMRPDMGLAAGGRMKQKIYDDPFPFEDWDLEHGSRCFVHLANSLAWQGIVGELPPYPPPTAKTYTEAGLPWFDLYDEHVPAVPGSDRLRGVRSVVEKAAEKGDQPLPENESITPERVVALRAKLGKHEVRDGKF